MSALIWCPYPDAAAAHAAADALLDAKLIACANIMAPMRSVFEWNGERGEGQEVGVLFKTDAALLEQAVSAVEDAHPYDCPAVLGWRCDAAGKGTAGWLGGLADGAGGR